MKIEGLAGCYEKALGMFYFARNIDTQTHPCHLPPMSTTPQRSSTGILLTLALVLVLTACSTPKTQHTYDALLSPGQPPILIEALDVTGTPRQMLFGHDARGPFLETTIDRRGRMQAGRVDLTPPVGSVVIDDRAITVLHTPWSEQAPSLPLATIYVINGHGELKEIDVIYRADMAH